MHSSPPIPPFPPGAPQETAGFRAFFRSLLGFIPFAAIAYVVFVGTASTLSGLAPAGCRFQIDRVLTAIPRNLFYRVGYIGHMFTRAIEARSTHDVDLLFIGSSHAYHSFDPRLFAQAGFKTFNLGSCAQSHFQSHLLLKRYLDRLNPKIVIYEVYPAVFADDGVESALDLLANDRNDFESVRMALRVNHLKVYNTLICGLFRTLLRLDEDYREPRSLGPYAYVPGGYVQNRATCTGKLTLRIPPQRPEQVAAFEDNLALLRKRGIRVILVQAPWPQYNYLLYRDRDQFDEMMKSYGEYYNFVPLVELDDCLHFFDYGHMNQTGVEIFHLEMIRRLFPERVPGMHARQPGLPEPSP